MRRAAVACRSVDPRRAASIPRELQLLEAVDGTVEEEVPDDAAELALDLHREDPVLAQTLAGLDLEARLEKVKGDEFDKARKTGLKSPWSSWREMALEEA